MRRRTKPGPIDLVAASVRMKGANAAEIFGELRERKNKS